MPGIHHVISRTLKDLVCRYKTMQGFQVKRKGGWDTHGLPVELGVENSSVSPKKILANRSVLKNITPPTRKEVLKYKDKWDEITRKMGYWVDLQDPTSLLRTIISKPFGGYSANSLKRVFIRKREYSTLTSGSRYRAEQP